MKPTLQVPYSCRSIACWVPSEQLCWLGWMIGHSRKARTALIHPNPEVSFRPKAALLSPQWRNLLLYPNRIPATAGCPIFTTVSSSLRWAFARKREPSSSTSSNPLQGTSANLPVRPYHSTQTPLHITQPSTNQRPLQKQYDSHPDL
jgi:hypothetical protein